MIETIHCFKHYVAMSTKPICIEPTDLFLSSSCAKALRSAVRSHLLKVWHDRFFENSMFVLTGLASLQICIKIISYVESPSHSLTRWVKLELVSINSNNQIANICGLAFVNFVNNSFTCRRYRPSFNQTFPNFQQQIFIAFCQWRQFCTWRGVQTNIGQDRKSTFKFEHVSAFVVLKLNHSLHSLQCWDKVFVFVPAQKDFEWRHFFLLPHKLFPKWNSFVFQ